MTGVEDQFEKEFQLWRRPLRQKLLHAPGRVLRTRLLAHLAQLFNRPIELQAPTFWGDRIRIVLPEGVSQAFYYNRFIEAGLTRFLLQRLRPGMVFVDAGAHLGYFSLLASRLVGEQGSVHAFEPTPATFERLRANTSSNANITINRLALWSEPTELDFNDFGLKFSGLNSFTDPRLPVEVRGRETLQRSQLRVRAIRLDDYLEEKKIRPDLVKIDAESAEAEVLKGMEETLLGNRPLLAVEVGDLGVSGAPESRDLIGWLTDRGYGVQEFRETAFVPHRLKESYPPCNLFFLPSS